MTASLDQRRRNRLSLNNTSSILLAGPTSIRPSHDDLRPPTPLAYQWDYAETIHDFDSGISTTIADPSTILGMSPPSTARFTPSPMPARPSNEVAPFHEPMMSPPSDTLQPTVRPRKKHSNILISDAAAKRPMSLFRSFKNLNLGKSNAKEEKQSNLPEILDITLQKSRQSSANSLDIDTNTIQQARKTCIMPASAALRMVDPSVKYHAFPPRDIGPTVVSLHVGVESSRISSDRSEDSGYARSRADSGTSISSGRGLLPSPPPVIPPRRSRPLPIPPVSAHSIHQLSMLRHIPSPPDTPLVNVYRAKNSSSTLPISSPFPITG